MNFHQLRAIILPVNFNHTSEDCSCNVSSGPCLGEVAAVSLVEVGGSQAIPQTLLPLSQAVISNGCSFLVAVLKSHLNDMLQLSESPCELITI